jgi:outer membrane protein OmpU
MLENLAFLGMHNKRGNYSMKSILLTTTAIVAFAGAAAADGHTSIDFNGSATLGWNNDDVAGEDGFYWDTQLKVAMSAALDNGVTATAAFGIEIDDEGSDSDAATTFFLGTNDFGLLSNSLLLSLTTETLGLHFGDTSFAAEKQWNSAGDMQADAFSEADGEVVLRADMMYSGVSASVSYAVANNAGGYVADDGIEGTAGDQLSIGASGAFGMVNFSAAYQAEADNPGYFSADGLGQGDNGDFTDESVFGVSAGTTVAGADITVAYAKWTAVSPLTEELTSIGIEVAYPMGPVTATAYYVAEDTADSGDADDNYGLTIAYADGPIAVTAKVRSEGEIVSAATETEWNLEASYDTGLGLTVLAGALNENEGDKADFYVGGTYDLGGGAEVLVMYGQDDDGDQGDEIGSAEYYPGTTVAVSFSF